MLPDLKTVGTYNMANYRSYAPGAFTPKRYSWFLLEGESAVGPSSAGRGYEKFQ